jgi:hypothetical protein
VIAKLQDQNGSNDYLANIVPESLYTLQSRYPYPVMGEMPAIRAAFDHFFDTVQTKETEQGVAMFSRSSDTIKAGGQPAARVQATVNMITSRWVNAPKVIVVQNLDDPRVPEAIRKDGKALQAKVAAQAKSTDAAGSPDGFIDKQTGTVFLIADKLAGDADVVRVLMHESLGHFGLRGVFGTELGTILDRMAVLNVDKVRHAAKRLGLDYENADQRRMAAEEVLAYMAQTIPELGWVKNAVAAVRTWLREHIPGFGKMRMTRLNRAGGRWPRSARKGTGTIQRATTWSEVYERFKHSLGAQRATDTTGTSTVSSQPGPNINDAGPVPSPIDS